MLQNGSLVPIAYSLAGQAIANQMKVPSREPTPNAGSGTSIDRVVDRSDVLKDVNNKKSDGNPTK